MKTKRSIQTKWLITVVVALMTVMLVSLFCLMRVYAEPDNQSNQDLTHAVAVEQKKDGSSDYKVIFKVNSDTAKAGDYFTITLPDGLTIKNQDRLNLTPSSDDKTPSASVKVEGKTVTVTLTDYAASHYDLSGSLTFKNAQGGDPSTEGTLSGTAYGTLSIQDAASDDDSLGVSGAQLVIKNKNDGSVAATVKTDSSGKAEANRLKAGDYTVETQTAAAGYEKSEAADVTITSGEAQTLKITSEPEKVEIKVNQIWDDNDDQDGVRPKTIKLTLYAEGSEAPVDEATVSADAGWATAFNARKYDADGKAIRYTVKESRVTDYELSQMGSMNGGFLLIHKHTPETVDIPVRVTWTDHNNRYDDRPTAVVVTLLKNGEPVDSQIVIANASGQWKTMFEGVDEYEKGQKIQYTVTENKLKGYTTKIDGTKISNRLKTEAQDQMMAAEAKRQQQSITFLKAMVRHPIQTIWSWLKSLF
ncbi:Cna B-type domain-containing protein [Pseudoramibacter porci]|nr:Cna B-type domain-containing protein [Pseudoramibacter porci]